MSVPSDARLVFKNIHAFHNELKRYDEKRKSVMETAVRVELFRLRKILKDELKKGGVAGRKFSNRRTISKSPPTSTRKTLSALAVAVRYWYTPGDRARFSLGFNDGDVWGKGQDRSAKRNLIRDIQISSSWRRIAAFQQDGGVVPVPSGSRFRGHFIRWGGIYEKRDDYPRLRKFFFLRKSTQQFDVPARPIIAPFWRAHEDDTIRNITSNFERKLRGERI